MKYISKGEWFDGGTEAFLLIDFSPDMDTGLFRGVRTCDNPDSESRPMGETYEDEENCPFDEFDVVENSDRAAS